MRQNRITALPRKIYEKYLSKSSNQMYESQHGFFRVTLDADDIELKKKTALGDCIVDEVKPTIIYVKPGREENEMLSTFLIAMSMYFSEKSNLKFKNKAEYKLCVRRSAMLILQYFNIDQTKEAADLEYYRTKKRITKERMKDIEKVSNYLASRLIEYFMTVFRLRYTVLVDEPKNIIL